ncbi:hypothetical protein DFH08DRAFT_863261 [Mycena albidolilacea]|uniref:Uncharacterized protein n=1 Tax=Mycena albidolilacea TaxID=1033008 RepID=A0AAD7A5E9_9AGAR|nr:hypothetical protein DFH08DRAFT_863261 [Mycena albidolilacea]
MRARLGANATLPVSASRSSTSSSALSERHLARRGLETRSPVRARLGGVPAREWSECASASSPSSSSTKRLHQVPTPPGPGAGRTPPHPPPRLHTPPIEQESTVRVGTVFPLPVRHLIHELHLTLPRAGTLLFLDLQPTQLLRRQALEALPAAATARPIVVIIVLDELDDAVGAGRGGVLAGDVYDQRKVRVLLVLGLLSFYGRGGCRCDYRGLGAPPSPAHRRCTGNDTAARTSRAKQV